MNLSTYVFILPGNHSSELWRNNLLTERRQSSPKHIAVICEANSANLFSIIFLERPSELGDLRLVHLDHLNQCTDHHDQSQYQDYEC